LQPLTMPSSVSQSLSLSVSVSPSRASLPPPPAYQMFAGLLGCHHSVTVLRPSMFAAWGLPDTNCLACLTQHHQCASYYFMLANHRPTPREICQRNQKVGDETDCHVSAKVMSAHAPGLSISRMALGWRSEQATIPAACQRFGHLVSFERSSLFLLLSPGIPSLPSITVWPDRTDAACQNSIVPTDVRHVMLT